MSIEHIRELDDPRLAPYRSLKQTNLTRWSGLFIAEEEKVVRRLMTSRYPARSILLSERKSHLAEDAEFAKHQVFILPQPLAEELAERFGPRCEERRLREVGGDVDLDGPDDEGRPRHEHQGDERSLRQDRADAGTGDHLPRAAHGRAGADVAAIPLVVNWHG